MRRAASGPAAVGGDRYLTYLRATVLMVLAYWAVYVLVAPVSGWDSQTYNLARLLLAEQGGLFCNSLWNDNRQVVFPWTFDALHYPFLKLGVAYALPSFACFCGLLVIVYRIARSAALDRAAAWSLCLSLLALPTLVFQATSTKNDFAVVFGLACWYYARSYWRWTRQPAYLWFMALAVAFAAGAKSSGVPMAAILAIFTAWEMRRSFRDLLTFVAALSVALFLLGSAEIYFNNWRLYGSFFGPAELIDQNRNRDGIAGAVANLIRYIFGNVSFGARIGGGHLRAAARGGLQLLGLENVGYREGLGDTDLFFLRNGDEGASDYGPFGMIALLLAPFFLISRRPTDPVWKLAAAGFAALVFTSASVAWMPWNNRFLLLPFTAFALALTVWSLRATQTRPRLRAAFLSFTILCAVLCPSMSFNRRPADLRDALVRRDFEMTRIRPEMLEIASDLRDRAVEAKGKKLPPLVVCAGGDSWLLTPLTTPGLKATAMPALDRDRLEALLKEAAAEKLLILILNRSDESEIEKESVLLKQYAEPGSRLLEWSRK